MGMTLPLFILRSPRCHTASAAGILGVPEPAGFPFTSEMEWGSFSCGGVAQLPEEAGTPASSSVCLLGYSLRMGSWMPA